MTAAASFSIVSFLCFVNFVSGVLPGAQVRLTNAGFDYGVQVAIKTLIKDVRSANIPDIHGESGHLQYDLTTLKITEFSLTKKSMRPVAGTGLSWILGGVRVGLQGNFAYHYHKWFIKISDHGTFRVSAEGLSIDLNVKITADAKTRKPVLSSRCNCDINDIDIKFTGGKAKWLYNLLVKLVEGKIKSIIVKAICKQANQAVNVDGNSALKTLKLTTPLADNFLLNYGLVENPSFTSQYMQTYHKGEVFWIGDIREAKFTPMPLPPLSNTTKMIYVWLSEYIANTFAYAAFTHHYLHYNLTAKELPKSSRHYLNTTCAGSMGCIGAIIPQIGAKYPNCTVKIALNATQAPTATVSPAGLKVRGVGEARFYAVTRTGQQHYMLHLGINMLMTATGRVSDDVIYAKVNTLSLKFHVIDSKIGNVEDIILDTIAKLAITLVVKPKLNEMGAKGFNLPVTGAVQFKDPKLTLVKGAIIIASDVVIKEGEDEDKPKSPWMDANRSFEAVGTADGDHSRKM